MIQREELRSDHGGDGESCGRMRLCRQDPNGAVRAYKSPRDRVTRLLAATALTNQVTMPAAAAIRAHFRLAKPGGLVVITYPTPTWLYRIIRSASEALGLWLFHDERPLTAEEVLTTVTPLGRVVSTGTNWLVGLTQGYVVARAPAASGAAPDGRAEPVGV